MMGLGKIIVSWRMFFWCLISVYIQKKKVEKEK